jgi:DNA polymerase III epsilon subunit-like protein
VAIHKITRERSDYEGIPIEEALAMFVENIRDVDIVVGHNIQFDKRMVAVELYRHNMKNCFYKNGLPIPDYCTMKRTTDICKLPAINKKTGETYNKYPTLTELHTYLFGQPPRGTHNAIADVMICLRCFIALVEKYDIVEDREVKLVFRSLYNSYCM